MMTGEDMDLMSFVGVGGRCGNVTHEGDRPYW